MSSRILTFIFNSEEKKVNPFANFEECKKAFQEQFSINDEDMKKLELFYLDEEGDQTMLNSNEDYNMFLISNNGVIEGQLNEVEKPDPMRSGTIFKKNIEEPAKDVNSKNFVDSFVLDNSLSLENSANVGLYLGRKNISNDSDFGNKVNEVNKLIDQALEVNNKEKMIADLQKQMEELKLKHQEEMKQKEEENQKKYNDALAKKENEIKKKIEEEKEKQLKEYKIKTESELKEKYENEMKSNIILKEKELNDLKSKIEIENQKKLEEIQRKENEKRLEEIKKKEEENSKKKEE